MTMLYLTGMSAVTLLLVFAMSDGTLRQGLRTETDKSRAQAEWIAKAGGVFGARHVSDLRGAPDQSIERELGGGKFVCKLERGADGREWIASTALVPSLRPRAASTVRIPVP
jgi:hypothetical protein